MRSKISLTMSLEEVIVSMAEGNPGALTVLMKLLETEDGLLDMLSLDDMNIRGTQIWVGYKDFCESDMNKFKNSIKNRDVKMITRINIVGAQGNHCEIAVERGASFNRRGL